MKGESAVNTVNLRPIGYDNGIVENNGISLHLDENNNITGVGILQDAVTNTCTVQG